MKKQDGNSDTKSSKAEQVNKDEIADSLNYPPSEDIYNQLHKESDINPADISKNKIPVEINNRSELNQKDFEEDMVGGDLDIPGAELDDAQEEIGSEDEENNHYSIGGDNHNNLEEDNG
ncbi:hypothetical protein FQU23_010320 [Flavobacterium sp. XN-5]|uniref:hypothetical protein n=1 Tax=Flavobacterium sp. XN-5 TaxID=2599390 RepID=UPI0011CBC446|nr:hypothetical protein [Flavobacterium sp. XN-5]NGY37906.1 hypothetical protein [Flavobacterium sp. XN-5]